MTNKDSKKPGVNGSAWIDHNIYNKCKSIGQRITILTWLIERLRIQALGNTGTRGRSIQNSGLNYLENFGSLVSEGKLARKWPTTFGDFESLCVLSNEKFTYFHFFMFAFKQVLQEKFTQKCCNVNIECAGAKKKFDNFVHWSETLSVSRVHHFDESLI